MLSGGMKRRLMIARALVHQPRLLILDEPTAGVDIELRRSMWQFLTDLNADGTTIILTTHYLEEAEALCQQIAIIDQGRILEHASKQALLKKLHCETFVLEPVQTLPGAPDLPGFTGRLRENGELEVQLHQGQTLTELLSLLAGQGIIVRSLRQKANRLEELFLTLVQKHDPTKS
jgi:ABC-2 type transport system ATP-binding protein